MHLLRRALNEGGYQAGPELAFTGGALVGCVAGFLTVAKIKGSHTAIKLGMLAAGAVLAALGEAEPTTVLEAYLVALKKSWVWDELYKVRNIRPGFRHGLWAGLAMTAGDTYLLCGRAAWTLQHHADHGR